VSARLAADETVYIGLGSNLAEPRENIRRAVAALKQLEATRYIADSGLFLSQPMGPQDQPDYLNAVAWLETRLDPQDLLTALQHIETDMGRVRERHWGPRKIDLDILLFGERIINLPALQVPHAGIAVREFVLYPLQRLNPELVIPAHGKLSLLLAQCPENGLQFVGELV
jgi:2-amino-4-hydroxy-6-hydroxymethyldihydropteridine diphosphokinase